jgi:DNA-binding transcriptional regulator YiaG
MHCEKDVTHETASKNRKIRRQRRSRKSTSKGREIIASLREALEVELAGIPIESRFTVRTVEIPDGPSAYDAEHVKATREKIAVSQAVFAQLLGVSVMLVRAWEQGQRGPALWARRLLDEVNRDPRHWRGMLRKAS